MLRLPMFTWTILVTSILILFAFPAITAALAMLLLDRRFGAAFFDPPQGGDPILWQHLFWFFGHPEVYIVVLPFFGICARSSRCSPASRCSATGRSSSRRSSSGSTR